MNYIEEIKACLTYCEQQNGRPDCKNCGLNQEMIDGLVAEVDRRAREEGFREGLEHDCYPMLDKAVRVGRANYQCVRCKADVSIAHTLYLQTLTPDYKDKTDV